MTDITPSQEDKTRYQALKNTLKKSLQEKRLVDKKLAQVEVQIYNLEAAYLTETAAHSGGNIIHGFEGYLKNQAATRRKYEINEQDRLFSQSSSTYLKSLDLGEGEESTATNDEFHKQSTPGLTTVIVPPATRNQELTQQKKLRDKDYQKKKRGSVSMRSGESEDEIVSAVSSSSRRATKRARLAEED